MTYETQNITNADVRLALTTLPNEVFEMPEGHYIFKTTVKGQIIDVVALDDEEDAYNYGDGDHGVLEVEYLLDGDEVPSDISAIPQHRIIPLYVPIDLG